MIRGILISVVICYISSVSAKQPPSDKHQQCDNNTLSQPSQGPPSCNGTSNIPGMSGSPKPHLQGSCPLSFIEAQQLKTSIQQDLKQETDRELIKIVKEEMKRVTAPCNLGSTRHHPAKSCQQIQQCNPEALSGTYWLETVTEHFTTIRQVYCNMDSWHCSSKGWTRVAYINMADDGATCPDTLRLITSPKNLCTRASSGGGSCSSVTYPTHRMKYHKVCGQAVGYQYWNTDAFHGPKDINSYYVDGMSITYGSPRKHIWTYAVGLSDDYNYPKWNCPCAKYPGPSPPVFVGDHYYCESGNTGAYENTVYVNDPLWDGEGCGSGNNCCAQPGMPWFCRTLPQEVEGDIEVRLCANEGNNENLYLELLEIYIQ